MPDWSKLFDDELDQQIATDTWFSVTRELRDAERLSLAIAPLIEMFVVQVVAFKGASRRVAEQSPVIARGRKTPQYNPWWTVMRQSIETANMVAAELMLSPRRRGNGGKLPKRAPKAIPAAAFLRQVKK